MSDTGRYRGGPRTAHGGGTVAVLGLVAVFGAVGLLAAGCATSPPAVRPASPGQQWQPGKSQLSIWLTGYSWQDNTPPGSSKVGEPVLHTVADGTGTFADPITVATPGHSGNQEWQPGTKFYLPTVQRYVIVEDSGAAKAPPGTDTHLDLWSAGQDATKPDVDTCMEKFTGKVPAQLNPPDGLPVMTGPIYAANTCNIPPQPDNLGTYDNPGGDSGGDPGGDGGPGH